MGEELPVVAMDIVMVGAGRRGGRDVAGRVTVINALGQCVYNTFVKHASKHKIRNYRTELTGITAEHISSGISYKKVKANVAKLIRYHILVGHGLDKKLKVLGLSHPGWNRRDSEEYFRTDNKLPLLRDVAVKYLGLSIKNGGDSFQNAIATLRLYKNYTKTWDTWVYEQFDEEQSDEEQSDEEQSDEEQSDEEQSDEEQSDEEQSDEEQSDVEMASEESEYDSEEEGSYYSD